MTERPLAGCTVVVTRPMHQSAELCDAIEASGGQAIRFPVLDIVGRDSARIAKDFAANPVPDLVIFISRNAARYAASIEIAAATKVAAIGPATAASLEAQGLLPDILPLDGFDSEALLSHPDLQDVSATSITIVRGTSGRELLADTLKARGANVNYLAAYERQLHHASDLELATVQGAFDSDSVNYVTIMSVQSLQNFLTLIPPQCLNKLPHARLVAPSERVVQTAEEMVPGMRAALSPGPQSKDMVNTLIDNWQAGQD